jgi:hypothetical protein
MNSKTIPITSSLLVNKLTSLVEKLQSKSSPTGTLDYQTQEQVSSEAHKLLSIFYKDLSAPLFQNKQVILRGTEPDMDWFNDSFEKIGWDLDTLFAELESLEGVILGSFNYMVSRANRLNTRLKQASSSFGNYLLYTSSNTKNYIFFGDSFGNLDKVEIRSPLLKEEQLSIHQEEGILTLPVDLTKQEEIQISETPVINANSNGTPGNNQEAGAQSNTDISKILDNNADTWFEYERVISKEDGVPLILDFTINIGRSQIVNFIRINPNNFGARTQLEVFSIQTSNDGKSYDDIKDDLLASDIVEDGLLLIAPSTSKFAGQGLYSFTPRKARYIRIGLKQTTPYPVKNSAGQTKLRYAVGIRDVHIESRPYMEKGEAISRSFTISDPVRKIGLVSTQNPREEVTTGTISHFISVDNGVTWHEMRPQDFIGKSSEVQSVPELLDFNGVVKNTISTESPVTSLRYKVKMERNPDAFASGNAEWSNKQSTVTEFHQIPTTTPFAITLGETPIEGTVSIIDPFLGSRGLDNHRYVARTGRGDESVITLPWKPVKRKPVKVLDTGVWYLEWQSDLNLTIDGVTWTHAALAGTSRYFQVDHGAGKIRLGDGTTGKAPVSGSLAEITFDEERLFPSSDEDHIAKLDYPAASDTKEFELYFLSKPKTEIKTLEKGGKIHDLDPDIDSSYTVVFSDTSVFNTEETFVDGEVELTATGKYSIDYENGIAYSYDRVSRTKETSCTYRYTPRERVTDFSFPEKNTISISKDIWRSHLPDEPETIPTGVYYFNLHNLAAVKGSLQFSDTTVFAKEVPFVDGRKELLGTVRTTQKIGAITSTISGSFPGLKDIPFDLQIENDANLGVVFSNTTIFATEVALIGSVDAPGKYWISRSGPTPYVRVYLAAAVTDAGTMTYYYNNPNANLSNTYSVRYDTGEVYTKTVTGAGSTVNYRYTDYRAKYPIAREVDGEDFSVNTLLQKVNIQDREIAKRTGVERGESERKYYRVSYSYVSESREDIPDLESYYTPVLMDYALKVLTEKRLI